MYRNVHLLTNDAAGSARALECPDGWRRWEISDDLTPEAAASRALENGADLVVACGGDGTVGSVACALVGSDVPLLIVPMGTANVFASDLGLPSDPDAVFALATGAAPSRVRAVDVGRLEDGTHGRELFVLRLGLGVEATMVTQADSDLKEKVGRLAYFAEFVRLTREQDRATYTITLDGRRETARGVTCLVCNSVNPGLRGVDLLPQASVADGKLTVVVFRWLSVGALFRLMGSAAWGLATGHGFHIDRSVLVRQFSGARVEVVSDPPQDAACDGDALEVRGVLRARVDPGALRVLVPA